MPLKYLKAPAEDEDSLCRVFHQFAGSVGRQ